MEAILEGLWIHIIRLVLKELLFCLEWLKFLNFIHMLLIASWSGRKLPIAVKSAAFRRSFWITIYGSDCRHC